MEKKPARTVSAELSQKMLLQKNHHHPCVAMEYSMKGRNATKKYINGVVMLIIQLIIVLD
jgi:hypothetical protein